MSSLPETEVALTVRMAVITGHGRNGQSFGVLRMGLNKAVYKRITRASILEVSMEAPRNLGALARDPGKT